MPIIHLTKNQLIRLELHSFIFLLARLGILYLSNFPQDLTSTLLDSQVESLNQSIP